MSRWTMIRVLSSEFGIRNRNKLAQTSWQSSVNEGSRTRYCPCGAIDRLARPSINQIWTGRSRGTERAKMEERFILLSLESLRIVVLFGRERERKRGRKKGRGGGGRKREKEALIIERSVRREINLSEASSVSLGKRFRANEALT